MKIGIQLYSVRDLLNDKESFARTMKDLKSYGYDEVQTAGLCGLSAECYANLVHSAGLTICGTHDDMPNPDNIEPTVQLHKTLQTTNVGIGGFPHDWGKPIRPEQVFRFIDQANRVGEALAPYGMKFTYHHHSFEFAKVDGKIVMDWFVQELDPKNISFVLDTCWIQNAGAGVIEWINKLAGRVDIIHLKDRYVPNNGGNDSEMTELGNGNINFAEVIRAAKSAGIKHFCYEQDENWAKDPMDSAKLSASYLKQII